MGGHSQTQAGSRGRWETRGSCSLSARNRLCNTGSSTGSPDNRKRRARADAVLHDGRRASLQLCATVAGAWLAPARRLFHPRAQASKCTQYPLPGPARPYRTAVSDTPVLHNGRHNLARPRLDSHQGLQRHAGQARQRRPVQPRPAEPEERLQPQERGPDCRQGALFPSPGPHGARASVEGAMIGGFANVC